MLRHTLCFFLSKSWLGRSQMKHFDFWSSSMLLYRARQANDKHHAMLVQTTRSPQPVLKSWNYAWNYQQKTAFCKVFGEKYKLFDLCYSGSKTEWILNFNPSTWSNTLAISYRELERHTFSSLSSENASTMIPNTMFRPMVVTRIKNVTSSNSLQPAMWNGARLLSFLCTPRGTI